MMRRKGQVNPAEVDQGPRVSDLLRTSRERLGQELAYVGQLLRIRLVYLQAIEEGRFDDLPGKTYAVGFVRAYSEHLGLDSEEVVRRFKQEINGLEDHSVLVFPSPVTERSVPGGAIMLVGLVVLGAAYGGWYFLTSQNRDVAELVPDLPAKFAELVGTAKDIKHDAEEKGKVVVSEEPQQTASEEVVSEGTSAPDEVTANDTPDTQEMAAKAREAVDQAAENTQNAEQTDSSMTQAVSEEVTEVANKVEAVAQEAAETAEEVVEKVEETAAAVAEEVREEAAEVVETEASEPAEVVVEPAVMNAVIVLKATDYAWVQVTDSKGKVLHTQVLNKGESYDVPKQAGLILRTGNAGGLEIEVDGTTVPAIGKAGEVRRKVLLDPQKLKAGSAVES